MRKHSPIATTSASNQRDAGPHGVLQDPHWNKLDSDVMLEPGGTLLAWLLNEARLQGHPVDCLAAELGVNSTYLADLRKGIKRTVDIPESFVAAAANYLGVPAILVKVASGQIRPSDFMMPSANRKRSIAVALRKVQADPLFGALLPQDVFTAAESVQHFVIECYQEASGQEIWPYRSLPTSLQFLQRAVLVQKEREEEVLARQKLRKD